MDITDKEYEAIIQELANRWKNLAYMNAEKLIMSEMSKVILEELLDKDISLMMTFRLDLLVNDLREIIGGIRRNK